MTKLKSLMLNLFLFSLFTIATAINAQAQNYGVNHGFFVTDTGNIHSVRAYKPNANLIPLFSPDGYFMLPETVTLVKSNYAINNGDTLITVDTEGY